MTHPSTAIVIAVALLALNLSAASAQEAQGARSGTVVYAHSNTVIRTEQVSYGDLNLTAEAGRQEFRGRVEHAVDRVCGGPTNDFVDLAEIRGFRTCRDAAMADAMPKMEAVMGPQRYPSVAAIMTITNSFK